MVSMNNRIGVIGDKDSILMFKAAGLEVFDASDAAEAKEMLKQLIREEFAIILITEDLAVKNGDVLRKAKANPFPAILPIPTSKGSTGFGLNGVKKDVEKAIGIDILFNRED